MRFLTPSTAVPARSPMATAAGRLGARTEVRDGWEIAIHFGDASAERTRLIETVGFVDRSSLRKHHGPPPAGGPTPAGALLGTATATESGGWVCPITPARALYLGDVDAPVSAVDLTCAYAALSLVGPAARELLARFCALDARAAALPIGGFRPGSVARTPGYLLRPAGDELLLLVGWAYGEYLYDLVADAAGPLSGGPVGASAYAEHLHA